MTTRIEFYVAIGYALSLALIALALEASARFAQRGSMSFSTAGFVYHRERDIWLCPRDQHLFPIFSEQKQTVYRAPATACNSCPSKAACTDSNQGREIKRTEEVGLKSEMRRFHRAMSVTLLTLASILTLVDFAFAGTFWQRVALATILLVFGFAIQKISRGIAA